MQPTDQEWVVIFNPSAGRGKAKKDKEKILKLLEKYKFSYQAYVTEYTGHATELTQEAIKSGSRKILGVGGDGTMNEIVNGIFLQDQVKTTDVVMGFIPVGSGNDWVKTVGIPNDYESAIKTLKTGNFFLHDVGKLNYHQDAEKKIRYFANIAGLAYDAFVVHRVGKKKKTNYKLTVLSSLLKFKPSALTLIIDGKEIFTEPVFSMAIGHGRFNGKGMMQLPDAMPDDGIFDVTVYHQPSKMDVIKNTGKLYDGSFVKLPFISQHTGRHIRIESDTKIFSETDGEELGHSPLEFEMLTQSLKIISGIRNKVV